MICDASTCDLTTCAPTISVRPICGAPTSFRSTSDRRADHPTVIYRETTASSSPWYCSPSESWVLAGLGKNRARAAPRRRTNGGNT